jgi:hypothetical protein
MVSTPRNLAMTHRVHTFKNIKLHYNACNVYFKPNCKLMKGQKMSKQNIIHCISHSFCGASSNMISTWTCLIQALHTRESTTPPNLHNFVDL